MQRKTELVAMDLAELLEAALPMELFHEMTQRVLLKLEAEGEASLTEAQVTYIDLADLVGEVGNGGLNQYFYNSSGDRAMQALRALDSMGPPELHRVFACAVTAFDGGVVPESRSARTDLMRVWSQRHHERLGELSAFFYRMDEELHRAARAYVLANRGDFDLPPGR